MASETLKLLRSAVLLSRSMHALAERGETRELVVQMHEREVLLRKALGFLEALKKQGKDGSAGGDAWTEVLSVLKEFDSENGLLVEALKTQRKRIVRNIAEAEGHRRLSAYAL